MKDPAFARNQAQLEKETQNVHQLRRQGGPMIIPIVFHVIHANGADNISDAQILDQVRILNEEFPRMMADTAATPAAFKPLGGSLNVEFRLATRDPNGNCTNGITRTYSSLAGCSYDWEAVKAIDYWPHDMYLNVWVVGSMRYSTGGSCNGGGYSAFPGGNALKDGIVIRGDLIGSIGTAATNSGWGNFEGRYLIHEMGHWFNLRHIWGDSFCGDDFVADTPPAEEANSGCPSFPHNPNNACGAGPDGEMFDNYMDYSTGSCLNIFSQGQVDRMTATLNSAVGGRNNLWTNANLIATGTLTPSPVNSCQPIAAMSPFAPVTICPGASVTFTDRSYNAPVTTRTWTWTGGTSANNASDSIVQVVYNTPGTYDVTLSVGNTNGTDVRTFGQRIVVLSDTVSLNYIAPFTEGFETNVFNDEWTIMNPDSDNTWQITANTNYSGSNCLMIENFNSNAPMIDDIISPAIDLSAMASAKLKFRVHYSSRDPLNTDMLTVTASANCGQTWSIIYSRNAQVNLPTTAQNYGFSYVPLPASAEWRQDSCTLSHSLLTAQTRFRFRFTSGGGNNIFIDDINIGGTFTGVNDILATDEAVNVFPNPSSGRVTVTFNVANTSVIHASLTDISGREVMLTQSGKFSPGSNQISMDASQLSAGMYLLRLMSDRRVISESKLIVQ